MDKMTPELIANTLRPLGFVMQRPAGDEAAYVRPDILAELYDRIEIVFMPQGARLVVNAALSAVRCVRTQYRGLLRRAGLEELCTDPENGVVALDSVDAAEWLTRLAAIAPLRCEDLAQREGSLMLQRTASARATAARVLAIPRSPAGFGDSSSQLLAAFDVDKRKLYDRMLRMPFVIGDPKLEDVYRWAVAALASIGEYERLETGYMSAPADSHIWPIRLIVDRLLDSDCRNVPA